jgi:anti-sigma B factor antagonist/stage II sporulation protein AA (anti-sigma F factor antagonist)
MNPLTISIRKKTTTAGASETNVRLEGILDHAGATQLLEELQPGIHSGTDQVVLDISGLKHIHADGVRALAKLAAMQEQSGGQFSLVNISGETGESRFEARELEGGVKILQLSGNLDLRGTQAVEQNVLKLCEGYRPRLLLDLSATDMIVSLGIRMLLQAIKTANAHGGRVLLLNPSPGVSSALEFSGLAQFIARGKESEVAAGMVG